VLLASGDGRRRVPPLCGAMWRSVIVEDVCPGRIVVIHLSGANRCHSLEVLSIARQVFAGICNVVTNHRIQRTLFVLMPVCSWNESHGKGVIFSGSETGPGDSHSDSTPCLWVGPSVSARQMRQEAAMQRWMSRSPPRAKFTANDWLVDNSNNLTWMAIAIVGLLLAGLITRL